MFILRKITVIYVKISFVPYAEYLVFYSILHSQIEINVSRVLHIPK